MPEPKPLPETLSAFTQDLIDDLRALRAGKITARDARVRAQIAREVLRSVHLQLEGMKFLADQASPPNAGAIESKP